MAEIFFMKTLKGLLSVFCYFGTGIIAVDEFVIQTVEEALMNMTGLSPAAKNIIFYLLIVFWVIKIFWFVYEKFHLEANERKLKMDKTKEEIIDMQESHEKDN